MYKVSKNFDMNISFDELIKYNKTCKINLKSTHHFETFEGILIYVSHPHNEEKFSIELGVDEDGIMYEGDYGCEDKFKEIPIEEGLKILEKYREFINAKLELECILSINGLSDNYIPFKIK
ncbi:uncharacterized protein CBO05P1_081 [Clostridium botulinum B str. Osaka05]|uniref:Uncharacterized protein n=1 Tax=Clostridium botulinum B str. Osaka05 TaxID=1407017 RepID=A0A060N5H4_CLOBO|nr:hypothetical protein [Clostridium botulinum]BAO04800.1 uncharacterized protein CBO05P1_081 [Clostridium botulinum B str. Osaka05]